MSSSECSDDDMPELESVSSSEYVTEEDDLDELTGEHYEVARQWLEQDHPALDRQLEVILVYLCSPVLYGRTHQCEEWLGWCRESGLLTSDMDHNTGRPLKHDERQVVDLFDLALQQCKKVMDPKSTAVQDPKSTVADLLELASEIESNQRSYDEVIERAKSRECFSDMLENIQQRLKVSQVQIHGTLLRQDSVELGCLYAVSQIAEHVKGHDYCEEFQAKVQSDEENGEELKKDADELFQKKQYKEAIKKYSSAIEQYTYNCKLYTNRALAYLWCRDYRSSLSDGLRAVVLNPSFPKGHVRYIVALRACGETRLEEKVTSRYHKRFTSSKDSEELKKGIIQAEKIEKEISLFEKIKELCKKAYESFRNEDVKVAIKHFEDIDWTNKGWRNCLCTHDWKMFSIGMHFAYGVSLLENGPQCAMLAIKEFQTILDEYSSINFVPAFWGVAQAQVLLGQHNNALLTANNGLKQLHVPLCEFPSNFTWPATDYIMPEAMQSEVVTNLENICERACVPDAICRYASCTQKTANIRSISEDYKGHVELVCSENCSIAYHPSCWRRLKNETVISSDRDFVYTPCPTPDCAGSVITVKVFDLTKKLGHKFEPPPSKAIECSSPAQTGKKKSKKLLQKSKAEAVTGKRPCSESGGSESSSKEMVLTKRSISDGSSADGSVCGEEEGSRRSSVPGMEDVRNPEDSVAIKGRAEGEQSKEPQKVKPKKKKEKKTLTKEQLGFEYSERGPINGVGPEEEAMSKVRSWVPDTDLPFQTPEHLREAIEQFESKEVPSMGLKPRPPCKKEADSESKSEFEYIYSYFHELFKTKGGLHPSDPVLTNALSLLPGDKKGLVETTGGLENFLLMSPLFKKSHGELICLEEDAPVIAASINSMEDSVGASDSWSEVGKNSKKKKSSKMDRNRSQSHSSEAKPGDKAGGSSGKAVNGENSSDDNSNSPLFSTSQSLTSSQLPEKQRSHPGSASGLRNGDNLKLEPLPRPISESTRNKENNMHPIEDNRSSRVDRLYSLGKSPVIGKGFEKLMKSGLKGSKVAMVDKYVHACPRVSSKGTMVNTIPHVESFRDRYEVALKEKEDLQSRLERSEDQKYKMQRDHKKELDRVQKQSRADTKAEYQGRIDELERKVADEKERLAAEKRDYVEQTRSLKTEIKSLSDKIDKMRKDAARKEKQHEGQQIQFRADLEHAQSEKRKLEDKLKGQSDQCQKMLRRAMDAEVEILSNKREAIFRPLEQRLREVEGLIGNVPKDHEVYREWDNYRDKLRTSLDSFVNAMDDQMKQVKSGKPLSQLDKVPTPAAPPPPQFVRMPLMRPSFVPMMVRPHSMPPPPMFDPLLPRPPPIPVTIGGPIAPPTGSVPPGSVQPQSAAVGASGALPSGGQQTNSFNDPSPSLTDSEAPVGGASKRMSSFDRIVEKLTPDYPQCNKGDFKTVLREVRHNNANSLSGLSLDNIISQIRAILDARYGRLTSPPSGAAATTPTSTTGKPLVAGTVVSGKNKRRQGSKGQQPVAGAKKSLPPVAVAEPPLNSEVEYDNDGSCIICYEDMTDEDSSTLNCGHMFHSECIRSWFNEQSTCPTCRNHSLLPDDYPTLK